jgi:hypothetical protein
MYRKKTRDDNNLKMKCFTTNYLRPLPTHCYLLGVSVSLRQAAMIYTPSALVRQAAMIYTPSALDKRQ